MSAERQKLLRAALGAAATRTTANGDGTVTIPGEAWATLVGTIVMSTNGDNDGQVPMGTGAVLDQERLTRAIGNCEWPESTSPFGYRDPQWVRDFAAAIAAYDKETL